MEKLFKSLIVIAYFTYSLFFFKPFFDHYFLDEKTLDILSWTGYGSFVPYGLNMVLVYLTLFLYLIASIGLYFFQPWAKPLFVGMTVISLSINTLSGVYIETAVGALLLDVTNLCDGAILAMLFLTPIGDRFRPGKVNSA